MKCRKSPRASPLALAKGKSAISEHAREPRKFSTSSQSTKAQGLSINTIIIAALGLAVLVILFAVFTGRIGIFGKNIDATQQQLTTCAQQCQVSGYNGGTPKGECASSNEIRIYGQFSEESFKSNPDMKCCCTRTP